MVQRIYLTKLAVAKQHDWFSAFTETCTKAICKIPATRQRNKHDQKQLRKQRIKSTEINKPNTVSFS